MRKNSSHSSRDSKPGGKSTFKKDDGRKPFNKDSKPFKKNYDGRSPSAGAQGDKPYRSAKPYSGRVADGDNAGRPAGDRKPFDKDSRPGRDGADRKPRKEFDKPAWENKKREDKERKPRKEFDKPRREFNDREGSERPPRTESDRPRREFNSREGGDRPPRKEFDKPRREFKSREGGDRPPRKEFDKPRREFGDKEKTDRPRREGDDRKPFSDRPKRGPADRSGAFNKEGKSKEYGDRKPRRDAQPDDKRKEDTRKFRDRPDPFRDTPPRPPKGPDVISFSKDIDDESAPVEKPFKPKRLTIQKLDEAEKKPLTKKGRRKHYHDDDDEDEEDKEINQKEGPRLEMPLNKYIAHSGECSRRDAADMVKQGKVKVNDELVLDPGYRVKHDDRVTLSGKKLTPNKGFVYILLNKPKGFITTNEDPQGRKTVMELVASSGEERIFPVGRLDKDTSGLLLMTNDGDLTQKLCHPSYNIKKVYHVTLDKPLTKADFEKVIAGVELEDGIAIVDEIAYLEAKNELGLEIHSGRNRIVRRIFESLGYVVDKLDRVMYAGLTKKNLPRSKWRYLNDREIVLLKHFKN